LTNVPGYNKPEANRFDGFQLTDVDLERELLEFAGDQLRQLTARSL
jgi:hypothetical protein